MLAAVWMVEATPSALLWDACCRVMMIAFTGVMCALALWLVALMAAYGVAIFREAMRWK